MLFDILTMAVVWLIATFFSLEMISDSTGKIESGEIKLASVAGCIAVIIAAWVMTWQYWWR